MTASDYNDVLTKAKTDSDLLNQINEGFKGLEIIHDSLDVPSPIDMITGVLRNIMDRKEDGSVEKLRHAATYMEACFIIKLKYNKEPCYNFQDRMQFVKTVRDVGIEGDFSILFPKSLAESIQKVFSNVDSELGNMLTDHMDEEFDMEEAITLFSKIRSLEGGKNRKLCA